MAAYSMNTTTEYGTYLYESFLERESMFPIEQSTKYIDRKRKSELHEVNEKLKKNADNFRNSQKRGSNKCKASRAAQELSRYHKPSLATFKAVTDKHLEDDPDKASESNYYVEKFFFLMDLAEAVFPKDSFIGITINFVKTYICPLVEKNGGWNKVFSAVSDWIEEHPFGTAVIAGAAITGLGLLLAKAISDATENSTPRRRPSDK